MTILDLLSESRETPEIDLTKARLVAEALSACAFAMDREKHYVFDALRKHRSRIRFSETAWEMIGAEIDLLPNRRPACFPVGTSGTA